MADDQTFRIILALGMAAFLPVGLYHRIRSQATREPLDRRQEGLFILFTLRPFGLASMGGMVAFILNPGWMAWASLPLPVWLRWVGVAIGVPALALGIWTFRSIGTNITDTVVTRREHTLVTHGPYRFVRHPFYATAFCGFLANALSTANWFIALTGAIALALIVARTTIEEAHLVKRFGDDYRRYMRKTGRFFPKFGGSAALTLLLVLSPVGGTAAQPAPIERHPNVIIITADDLGYGDLGSYGHPTIRTPVLDQLAAEGQRWTSFYAQAPVCSPSRAALLTGRLHLRSGMFGRRTGVFFPDSLAGLPADEVTLAEVLREVGYATGIVGKWHLGHLPQYLPTRHGFDSWFGIPYSNDMDWNLPDGLDSRTAYFNPDVDYWQVPLMRDEAVIERPAQQATITRRYTEEAVRFIGEHRDEPFFLYVPHSMPHMPLFVSDAYRDRSAAGIYGDVIEEIDGSVGEIVDAVETAGLADRTLVVFTSDNGPWLSFETHAGTAGLLRDGKGTTFEGGMRVPGIFWWPGTIEAGVTQEVGSSMDLFTTVVSIAGGTIPDDRPIDGVDLSPVLFDAGASPRRTMAYYRMGALFAFRLGAYKVHFITEGRYALGPARTVHDPPLLFNLDVDPAERYDVAATQPEALAEVLDAVARHRAGMTVGEPLFDLRGQP